MTPTQEAAMRQALEAMQSVNHANYSWACVEAITALKAALAEHFCDTHCTWADHAPGCVRAEPPTCAWHGDEEGAYETSCKHMFQFIDGTPQENEFTHCCFCGKALVQHLWEYGNDE